MMASHLLPGCHPGQRSVQEWPRLMVRHDLCPSSALYYQVFAAVPHQSDLCFRDLIRPSLIRPVMDILILTGFLLSPLWQGHCRSPTGSVYDTEDTFRVTSQKCFLPPSNVWLTDKISNFNEQYSERVMEGKRWPSPCLDESEKVWNDPSTRSIAWICRLMWKVSKHMLDSALVERWKLEIVPECINELALHNNTSVMHENLKINHPVALWP